MGLNLLKNMAMIMMKYTALIVLLFGILHLPATAKEAKLSSALIKTITPFYDRYDSEDQCWITKTEDGAFFENHYCLRIIKVDIVDTKFGKRRYIVLTSVMLDKQGEDFISHVSAGMAALFIVKNSDSTLIATLPKITIGAYSTPPSKWSLMKLAPSDYWGWRTQSSDAHGGYFGGKDLIYAPYGKKGIKNIAAITAFFSNEGTGRYEGKVTSLETQLSIIPDKSKRVYSLKLVLSGKEEGKKISTKSWVLPFDLKRWSYSEPKRWALSDIEY